MTLVHLENSVISSILMMAVWSQSGMISPGSKIGIAAIVIIVVTLDRWGLATVDLDVVSANVVWRVAVVIGSVFRINLRVWNYQDDGFKQLPNHQHLRFFMIQLICFINTNCLLNLSFGSWNWTEIEIKFLLGWPKCKENITTSNQSLFCIRSNIGKIITKRSSLAWHQVPILWNYFCRNWNA